MLSHVVRILKGSHRDRVRQRDYNMFFAGIGSTDDKTA